MCVCVCVRERVCVCVCMCVRAWVGVVENKKTLKFESLVTDLEYAANIALLSDNWFDLTTMLDSLSNCCKKLGLAFSCKKNSKTLAVLPSECSHIQTPVPIHLVPGDDPIELSGLSSISSTQAALFKIIVDWLQRLIPESVKPHMPSSHSLGSCGIKVRSRAPSFVF